MSFYFMKNYSCSRNLLKIGYMSTTSIKNIISRYATGCGNNITVFQFPDSDPRQMEQQFKTRFRSHHVELEFFDSNHFFDYLAWCTAYTKASPIVGDGNLKCVSNTPTRTVNVQCDIRRDPPAVTDLQVPPPPPPPPPNVPEPKVIHSNDQLSNHFRTTFVNIDGINVQCIACDKIIRNKNKNGHLTICQGVPKNTCRYCLRKFNNAVGKCNHQKICKLN